MYYQLIVPRSLRKAVLDNVHADAMSGHFGVQKTNEKLQKYAYWQGCKKDVEIYVRRCDVCCRYRHGPGTKQGPMQLAHGCTVWQKIHIDLTGPHVRSRNGFTYLLTIICSSTKFLVAVPLRDKTALSVAKAMRT
jgi:Integrase zinc binding domain